MKLPSQLATLGLCPTLVLLELRSLKKSGEEEEWGGRERKSKGQEEEYAEFVMCPSKMAALDGNAKLCKADGSNSLTNEEQFQNGGRGHLSVKQGSGLMNGSRIFSDMFSRYLSCRCICNFSALLTWPTEIQQPSNMDAMDYCYMWIFRGW